MLNTRLCARLMRTLFTLSLGLMTGLRSTPLVAQALNGPGGGMEAAHPWLGVAIEAGKTGVLITRVMPDTPAASAGMAAGDEITAVDTQAVKTPQELIKTVQAQGVGNQVAVHFLRAGKAQTKTVKLVARPDELEMLRSQLVGKPMPPFKLNLVSGAGSGDSAKLKGKVAVVEFWATWCPACRSTHAQLSAFAKQHAAGSAAGEIPVLAISDEDEPTIKAYIAKTHPAFTVLSDPQGTTQAPWYVSAIPELAVVDQAGNIAYATIGAGEYLAEALAKAESLAKAAKAVR